MTREEALKIVRENYPHFGTTEPWLDLEKALATLIPELRESEDERIYNEIMEFFKMNEKRCIVDNSYTRWIAWLEKQKGKMTAEEFESSELFQLKLETKYANGYQDGLAQKEQKPAEWSEEDRLHYVNVLGALEYVKGCKSDYDKIEAVKSDIDWLKSLRPQWKPSEEQMEHLQRAINYYESDWGENKLLRSLIYDLKNMM